MLWVDVIPIVLVSMVLGLSLLPLLLMIIIPFFWARSGNGRSGMVLSRYVPIPSLPFPARTKLMHDLQYEDKTTKSLMMLPTDLALVQDKTFKSWVEKYAKDNDLFFKDFSAVITKLFELGVPFAESTEKMVFKPTNA